MSKQHTPPRLFCSGHAAFALLIAIAVVGCKGPDVVKAPHVPGQDPLPAGAYPQVVLHSGLHEILVAEKPIVTPAHELTPMSVRVPIRSTANNVRRVKYRLVFYGPNKQQLTDNPVWRSVAIPGRTRRFFTGSAIQLAAVDWELEIKSAD